MIEAINKPFLPLSSEPLDRRQKIIYLFIILNVIGIIHFGGLSMRQLYPGVVQSIDITVLGKLLITYNIWAISAIPIIYIFGKKRLHAYQQLGCFLFLASVNSLAWAILQHQGLEEILKGTFVNFTGLVHVNALFYLALLSFFYEKPERTENELVKEELLIKTKQGYHRLIKEEIESIKAEQNYIFIHTKQYQKGLLLRMKISDIEKLLLQDATFFRIHRSYIINLKNIIAIEASPNGVDHFCITKNKDQLPISRSKKRELIYRWKEI